MAALGDLQSNRVTVAIGRARDDVRASRGEVPIRLRDAHYQGARSLGHGAGYEYPHDDPRGWVPQQYRPDEVQDHVYYEPSDHGAERRGRPDDAAPPPSE